jgi:hypothetical protein
MIGAQMPDRSICAEAGARLRAAAGRRRERIQQLFHTVLEGRHESREVITTVN